ncbi:hypothetical protein FQS90_00085 [Enterococcus casseliflavus]|uniref:hypothetical protein n=1 Tax=unclassified Enterococcus TaxID=2608891 RepID=UPI000B3ECBC2|nr:hypothetical protein [Enterococcus sp. 8E11_MSG4843]MBO1094949.1 hypothetical protein [Enterococcus casseliflavus]MBO1143401.1 hypothetical protein [Enterococcus casseliflavus]MBV6371346.1 hypothetical protein [Enterococcus casseliflavus]OUZ32522.1 hypothetical protein A5885_002802 [Enterococcus sp. 8E11_MSG4843]
MDIDKFLIELRKSHQKDAFTDYVKEHWHEAVSEIENHQMSMDDVNVMIAGTRDDADFSLVKENLIEELEDL